VAKRPRKPNKSYYAPSQGAMRRMQDAMIKYDEAVTKLEAKWGVDRLPWLAGEELRGKFEAQMDKLNNAIDMMVDVEHQAEVTMRGLVILERAAIANGYEPLSGEYWEAPMPDGRVLAITRTGYDVGKVQLENREMLVYSVDEIGKVLQAYLEQAATVAAAKEIFPGATIEKIRTPTEKELNDEIPF
jgi:hypothetical protein